MEVSTRCCANFVNKLQWVFRTNSPHRRQVFTTYSPPSTRTPSRQGWVLFERTHILSGILSGQKHFIKFVFVETPKFRRRSSEIIQTWSIRGKRAVSSQAGCIKQCSAPAFCFSMQICYMFVTSKCVAEVRGRLKVIQTRVVSCPHIKYCSVVKSLYRVVHYTTALLGTTPEHIFYSMVRRQ